MFKEQEFDSRRSIFNFLREDASPYADHAKIIDAVFENNGYIAGGFARRFFLNNMIRLSDECPYSTYASTTQQDIDVWFNNVSDYGRFMRTLMKMQYPHEKNVKESALKKLMVLAVGVEKAKKAYLSKPIFERSVSIGGYALNINLTSCSDLPFQVIHTVFAKPKDVLSTFDITNCKVALTKDSIIYDERIVHLESNGLIHVDNWTSENSIFRLRKYLNQYTMKTMTDETAISLTEYVKDLVLKGWKTGFIIPPLLDMKNHLTNDCLMLLLSLGAEQMILDNPWRYGYRTLIKTIRRQV